MNATKSRELRKQAISLSAGMVDRAYATLVPTVTKKGNFAGQVKLIPRSTRAIYQNLKAVYKNLEKQ